MSLAASSLSPLSNTILTAAEVDRILNSLGEKGWNGSTSTSGTPLSSYYPGSTPLQYGSGGQGLSEQLRGASQLLEGGMGKDALTDRSPEEVLLNLRYSKSPTSPEECLLMLRSGGPAQRNPGPEPPQQSLAIFNQLPKDPKFDTTFRKAASKTQGALLNFMRTEAPPLGSSAGARPSRNEPGQAPLSSLSGPSTSGGPSSSCGVGLSSGSSNHSSRLPAAPPYPSQPPQSKQSQMGTSSRDLHCGTLISGYGGQTSYSAFGQLPPSQSAYPSSQSYMHQPPSHSDHMSGRLTNMGSSRQQEEAAQLCATARSSYLHEGLRPDNLRSDNMRSDLRPTVESLRGPGISSADALTALRGLESMRSREAGRMGDSAMLDQRGGGMHHPMYLSSQHLSQQSLQQQQQQGHQHMQHMTQRLLQQQPPQSQPSILQQHQPAMLGTTVPGTNLGSLGLGPMGGGNPGSLFLGNKPDWMGGTAASAAASAAIDELVALQGGAEGRGRKRRLGGSGVDQLGASASSQPAGLSLPSTTGRRQPGQPKLNLRDKILILEDQVRQATQLNRKLRLVSDTLKQLVLARRAQDEEMDEARARQLEMQNDTLRHLLESVRKVARSDTNAVLRLTEEVMSFLNQQVPVPAPTSIPPSQVGNLGLPPSFR